MIAINDGDGMVRYEKIECGRYDDATDDVDD